MLQRLAIVFATITMLLGVSAAFAEEDAPSALERDGLALAERMCAQCHAIGKSGASAHSGAPAFRHLNRRVDLDGFAAQLREGLISGHPDMLTFRFSREDARALTAYLRYIQE
jgi:cytochrome c